MQAFWESMFFMSAQIARMNIEYASRAISQSWAMWITPSWTGARRPTSQTVAPLQHRANPASVVISRQRKHAFSRIADGGPAPVHKEKTANASRGRRLEKR